MKTKPSHPERYLYVSLVCLILLFLNFLRTDSWTGDKPFSEFLARDWQLFTIFMIEETIIISVMLVFWWIGQKNIKKQKKLFLENWEKDKYLGIKPGDYDYVWFDFSNTARALILRQDAKFKLYVQGYNEHARNWEGFNCVGVYDSLEAVKIALFYECEFYCTANAELNEHDDTELVEEIKIPISSVQDISRDEMSVFDNDCNVLKVDFFNAHRCWCRKHSFNRPDLRYVCDRMNNDGEKKMIFYTNPRIIIVANKDQEALWQEVIEKLQSVECFSFDID